MNDDLLITPTDIFNHPTSLYNSNKNRSNSLEPRKLFINTNNLIVTAVHELNTNEVSILKYSLSHDEIIHDKSNSFICTDFTIGIIDYIFITNNNSFSRPIKYNKTKNGIYIDSFDKSKSILLYGKEDSIYKIKRKQYQLYCSLKGN